MGGTCLSIPAKQGCSSSQRDVPRTPGALSPVRTDAMEELSKVTKISPNCRPTFKNDSGILVLQCRVYLDDHVPTRGPWRLTAGTTQRGQRGARWILSSAPSPRSWGQTPGRRDQEETWEGPGHATFYMASAAQSQDGWRDWAGLGCCCSAPSGNQGPAGASAFLEIRKLRYRKLVT